MFFHSLIDNLQRESNKFFNSYNSTDLIIAPPTSKPESSIFLYLGDLVHQVEADLLLCFDLGGFLVLVMMRHPHWSEQSTAGTVSGAGGARGSSGWRSAGSKVCVHLDLRQLVPQLPDSTSCDILTIIPEHKLI